MITLRENKTAIPTLHSFVILKGTKSTQFAQLLGFITKLNSCKKGSEPTVTVEWLHDIPTTIGNANPVRTKVNLSNLITIIPYYKNGVRQGEVAKSSYLTLFNEFKSHQYGILKANTLIDPTEFDLVIHKTKAIVHNEIRILSAKVIFVHNLNTLNAIITDCYKQDGIWKFDIKCLDSLDSKVFGLKRSDFELVSQDEYVLMSAKCSHCQRF